MVTAAIVVGSVLAYLTIGFFVGRGWSRWVWLHGHEARMVRDYPSSRSTHAPRRRSAATSALFWGIVWPFSGPILGLTRMVNGNLVDVLIPELRDKRDAERVAEAEAENQRLQVQISDLHRQLGIAPLTDPQRVRGSA